MHQCIKCILFWNNTLHVSDGLSVHHQEFKTVHTATGICQTDTAVYLLASTQILLCVSYRFVDSCEQTCMTYIIAVCTVKVKNS